MVSKPIYSCKKTIVGVHSLKIHKYKLLLIRRCLYLIGWCTQKVTGHNPPSKRMFHDLNSTVNHIVLYINIQWCISQTQPNFIMFVIVLGQHVSIRTESSSGPSKNTDPYLAMFKMRCGIPNAYILDITIYKMHVLLCSYYTIRILISKTFNQYVWRRLHV